ncbi:hypothetical protein PR048_010693 [Dryococelus australis]|uniref:PiggyBac transposable element-derived protein domain-containing protein n=1 Tax=Dryococelus australis TaxID=614101 RepID=A0ABQ9I3F3_9NEOP|nr:hypothetical protein PR048_010693 [Dryococelus australis]
MEIDEVEIETLEEIESQINGDLDTLNEPRQQEELRQPSVNELKKFLWEKTDFQSPEKSNTAETDIETITERRKWTPLNYFKTKGKSMNANTKEVKKFIGVGILMASLGYPHARMFWKRSSRVSLIADVSRNIFFQFRKTLKCVNDNNFDPFWMVRNGCMNLPRSGHIAVDEQMIPFIGTTHLKQFIKGTPNTVGLKNFVLAFRFSPRLLYVPGKRIHFYKLAQRTRSANCARKFVYLCDRFFTLHRLVDYLLRRSIFITETVMVNRIPKIPFTNEEFVRQDRKVTVVKWYDNKGILLMSCKQWGNKRQARIDISRPQIVKCYNYFMGGVNLKDRMMTYYGNKYRTNRWALKTIPHFFDLASVNSWLLYRQP